MSEYFTGITFPQQKVTPSYDAVIRKAMLGDGVLTGCELSYFGSTLTMGAGLMIACGRQFLHTSVQNWAVSGATSGYARLLLTIDTTRASTKDIFDQILDSIEYATALDGFPDLQQSDINQSGTIYQLPVCVVSLGAGGITGIVGQMLTLDEISAASKSYVDSAVKTARPWNLLDNSDFTNPVNQRGFVSGSKVNAYGYFIDRWIAGQHDINPIINANGISNISGSEVQQLLDLSLYVGKKLTMVVYSEKNIPMYFCSGVISNNPEWTAIAFSDNWECAIIGRGLNVWAVQIGVACKYVALYEGEYTAETLPEYQPKGYANELLACNVADSGNVSGMKLLWQNASPASAFAAQTISLDLSGYDFVFISCFASNYGGGTDKESHFAIKGEKTTLNSQGSVFSSRDVTVSATGLTFTDGVQRPTYGNWTGNTDNYGIVPDKIYGIKGVSA